MTIPTNDQEIFHSIAFSMLSRVKAKDKNQLLDALGSATEIYQQRNNLCDVNPSITKTLEREIQGMDAYFKRAEEEMEFMARGNVQALARTDERYPQRLRNCPDAPTLLYYCGSAPLNVEHVVSIVGTRQITAYGKDLCASFIKDLSRLCPGVLVVSGLAYGVDIHSHRAALDNGLPTVAVLAHGLEQIYPRMHRDTAISMVEQGGLLTEYLSRTPMDKRNFVQRNRIVAGMADAVVVVESARKGGSLITAEMALDYGREVMAFPGRVTDTYSAGCNHLISSHGAQAIVDAEQFMECMGWGADVERQQALADGVQQELFPDLSPDETKVFDALMPVDGTPLNALSIRLTMPIPQLSSILFSLEMKGLVKKMGGNSYRRA